MSFAIRPLAVLCGALLLALSVPAFAAEPPKQRIFIDGVPDTGQFLPNSEVLATIGDRRVRVIDYRVGYFGLSGQNRPSTDSLGRAEFLTNMIRKDVLGLRALQAGYKLNFEDRAQIREIHNTVISNRLFEREVLANEAVPEDSIRYVYGLYKYDIRARLLFFTDRSEALNALENLRKKKVRWEALAATHTPPAYAATKGEVPFTHFEALPLDVSLGLWPLPVGGLSELIYSATGYQIVQVLERKPRSVPAYEFLRNTIQARFDDFHSNVKKRRIINEAKQGMDAVYDSTNIAWTSRQFSPAVVMGSEEFGQSITIDENVPEIAPADTGRLLVTYKNGRITVGTLLHAYTDLPPVMRPSLTTAERVADYADAIMLAPRMIELAVQRGLESDPVVKRAVANKTEELLVTKMVEDSVFTRVMVTPKERRDYYEKNRNGFVTYPKVRYATIVRDTRPEAEAIKARIMAGEKATDIAHADSLRGDFRSGIRELSEGEHDPMNKLLFEELRPGQAQVLGPDSKKMFACFALIDYEPGQQLSYAEVEGIIDESVRNLKAEAALNAFVDRIKTGIPITARYDQLMRVMLVTPTESELSD